MVQVRVKICGITREQDALAAAMSGADAIGLVFYAPSSRHIQDVALARRIALSVGPFVTVVGLFVDPQPAQVESILEQVPLHLLQFHGGESPEFCCQFSRPYLKAVAMKPEINLVEMASRYASASGILLDTYKPGQAGGTGESFDWARIPRTLSLPWVLAGGLSPENIEAALSQTRPYGVDVSGGVEDAPGLKNSQKIADFVRLAKAQPSQSTHGNRL